MRLKSLHIYPVKACRSVDLQAAEVRPRGLRHDRRWMIINADNQFLSQRNRPKLAQLCALADDNGLRLDFNGHVHRAAIPYGERVNAQVWSSIVNAPMAKSPIHAALSDWLGEAVRLVYMDAAAARRVNEDWAAGHETSFSDGFPILIANSASLDAVNDYIVKAGHKPVSMARFRPNIVIETDRPYAEDDWKCLDIGDVQLDLVKPCTRCIVTTLDPLTGTAQPEPVIEALNALRMSSDPRNKGVLFGVNAVVRKIGRVEIGQTILASS